MKTRLMIVCLALIFSGTSVFAQLSKAEKKEWKKKAKEMKKHPENLKQLSEEKVVADTKVVDLSGKVTQLEATVGEKDARIAELEDQLSRMRGELASCNSQLVKLRETPPAPAPMDFSKGVVFKVQVGAFKNKDLQKYFDNNPNFGGEAGKEPTDPQKLTIGIFRDYWEADTFKKYMREMGVKDAWIVPYRDGVRVEIKDVLDGVVGDKPKEGE
jgi:vacuolar-type H+-ATPase subunit I/STV1